jgi:FkbM family methyltransferase
MTTAQWADEAKASAATIEHEWDRRALDWPLTQDSTVVEVGGYKGRWALQIAQRYHPRLFVFEPQPWAAITCKAVLGDQAQVLTLALGVVSGLMSMGEWGTDGCSLVKDGAGNEVAAAEIGTAFAQLKITTIDLMLVNIEGYEYTLLPHMFDQGIYPDRLMVQFHTFADPDGSGARAIAQRMADRYRLAWDYAVLTAWEKA